MPTETDGATKAALLAAQEVDSTSSAPSIETTPWETAGYNSRREWLLSGEYVPEGMEGQKNYIVHVVSDEVSEEDRLMREKQLQEEFEDNPLASYEHRIENAEERMALAERSVEHAYEMLTRAQAEYNKYQSEFGKYPDFEKDINGRIANAHANIKEAQERVEKSKAGIETAKASYAEAVEREATREPGPVFNISYKLTDMATPINPGEEGYPDITLGNPLSDNAFSSNTDFAKKMRDLELGAAQQHIEAALQQVKHIKQLSPESAVPITATISVGNKLVATIDANGYVLPQESGQYLYSLNGKADALGLKGQARVDFMKSEIEQHYSSLKITSYTPESRPTQREFAQQWFPDMAHTMDADYEQRLTKALADVEWVQAQYAHLLGQYDATA